eukprot:CAMPEP_0174294790 /NCGR_PEP_ID=MMETSP0809-20121228/42625_1 /TAXON_ID=73025 ORGANISM="Eutreptiella gymnastica-like, Strain CCMP1594" /NCGR_SAMPLE_ID=MMETSP0809 /ASSEMBLY_ACC=CAM_ASM_000658 /LENGTH=245 /DNA_ID=CAMNT_0015396497 /DNA_START=40 /DNA_END=777 /DNA_ORIENTATION=+
MPTHIYIKARGTIPPIEPELEIEEDATIDDLKKLIKKKLATHKAGTLPCPLMAALPAESITLYIYNRSSDDYLQQLGSRKILDNPMPEHFNGAPGTDPEHPLFFDYDLPEDWPPVEVLTNPKVTACNTSASLPPEMDTSEGIRYYVKARGTVPHIDPVFYIQEHYTISDLRSMIKQVLVGRDPALYTSMPETDITVYVYNRISDDYLPQMKDRRLLHNCMPEHFSQPPGCDPEHPVFFDYIRSDQ